MMPDFIELSKEQHDLCRGFARQSHPIKNGQIGVYYNAEKICTIFVACCLNCGEYSRMILPGSHPIPFTNKETK